MRKLKFKKNSLLKKLIIVAVLLFIVYNIIKVAILYRKDDTDEMMISIQNDVGVTLAHDPIIENDVVYFSEEDVRKYFDPGLYYEDEAGQKRFISVVSTRVMDIKENETKICVNGVDENIKGTLKIVNGIYYFPISDLENVYNIKVTYLADKNRLHVDKLSLSKKVGYANFKLNIKSEKKVLSKVVAKVDRGDTLTIVDESDKNWYKVLTSDYSWGYVKRSKVIDEVTQRGDLGTLDFSDFDTQNAKILDINNSSYKYWSDVLATYSGRQLREQDITNKAIQLIVENPGVDIGVRISLNRLESFDNYYKFLKELKAYLNDAGICLIVTNEDLDTFLEKEKMIKSVSDKLE